MRDCSINCRLATSRPRRMRPPKLWLMLTGGFLLFLATFRLPAVAESPHGYAFTKISTLGDPATCGGSLVNDFEPYGAQNSTIAFAADLSSGLGEGIFVKQQGLQISPVAIACAGEAAPGGGVFVFDLGRVGLNQGGDVVFAFVLDPFTTPIGLNSGVYRFSHSTQTLTALLKPGDPAPGGGTFQGTFFNTSINNQGAAVFPGIVTGTDIAPGSPGVDGSGLGTGLFRADKTGTVSKVVRPGDPAPGGKTFDWASNGWINDGGDIAFGAHVQGDECIDFGVPQSILIFCAESVYLKKASSGAIQSIAHQGAAAPGGGVFRFAFGPVVNNADDIVFLGDLTPAPDASQTLGVFLYSKGEMIAVARPGDSMPGGGHFFSAGQGDSTYHLNNQGDVSFSAVLDTVNGDGTPDTGVYVYSKAAVRLVARTGTVIPGLGTIANVGSVPPGVSPPSIAGTVGGIIDERGQVLFSATLTDGTVVLLTAVPHA